MPRTHILPAAVTATLFVQCAAAGAPAYDDYELYLRGNFASNPGGAFNVPGNNFISNETVGLDDDANISVRLSPSTFGGPAVWAGDVATGGVVYSAVGGAVISTTSLNNNGRIVWNESFSAPDGIYGVDIDGSNPGIITNGPIGASSWTAATINDAGNIGYRAGFASAGNAHVIRQGSAESIVAAEVGVDFESPYSFLFTPDFNNNNRIASKVRLAPGFPDSNPDEIRLFAAEDRGSVLIARDDDADPASPYASFDNSLAVNDNDEVAFIATLTDGSRGVFLSDGTATTTIATETDDQPSDIEFFAPDVNNNGVVVFRAFDSAGLRAIFAGNGDWLVRVVTENDILPTDLGDARADQNTASSPVFGGGPSINDNDMVAFTAGLTPPDNNQIEWGTGVFVATPTADDPTCPGDCDDDGQVDFSDLVAILGQFNTPGDTPGCDADGSGTVTFGDLVTALGLFGPCPE